MYTHILVPLDESALAECVLPHVRTFATTFGSKVTLLRVLEHPDRLTDRTEPTDLFRWNLHKAGAEAYLAEVAKRLRGAGCEVETTLLEGKPAENIVQFVRHAGVDLVILSSHGDSGLTGWTLGNVVQKTVSQVHTALMVVRAFDADTSQSGPFRYQRLLLPLDGSVRSECAMPVVCRLARYFDAELVLVHVVEQPELPRRVPLTSEERQLTTRLVTVNRREAERYLDDLSVRLSAEGIRVRAQLVVGEQVEDALHTYVKEHGIDLVVMAAHGYSGGAKRPFGSTVINVLFYGSSPLLVVQDLKVHEVEPAESEIAASEYQGH